MKQPEKKAAKSAKPPIEKVLYSQKDVAFALSISPRAVQYLIAGKKLKTRRFGYRVLIPRSEVLRLARQDNLDGCGTKDKPS